MFSNITKTFIFLFTGTTLFLIGALAYPQHKDFIHTKRLLHEQELASSHNLLNTTEQHRKAVVKEIWLTQEDRSRLHYRLSSESSLLTVKPEGRKWDLIEKLDHIKCWMQDQPIVQGLGKESIQQVRFLQAKTGVYRFAFQEFLAQSVTLSLYRLPGQALPKEVGNASPFLTGTAEHASFSVSGKNPQFKAEQFKAQLNATTTGI